MIEISGQNLLDAVKQMAPEELDVFTERALSRRAGPKLSTLSARETKLISRIYRGLPEQLSKRYAQSTHRLKKELLTADEHQELLEMTREAESRGADRAAALLDLAKLRRAPLRILMKQKGIEPPPIHGCYARSHCGNLSSGARRGVASIAAARPHLRIRASR